MGVRDKSEDIFRRMSSPADACRRAEVRNEITGLTKIEMLQDIRDDKPCPQLCR